MAGSMDQAAATLQGGLQQEQQSAPGTVEDSIHHPDPTRQRLNEQATTIAQLERQLRELQALFEQARLSNGSDRKAHV